MQYIEYEQDMYHLSCSASKSLDLKASCSRCHTDLRVNTDICTVAFAEPKSVHGKKSLLFNLFPVGVSSSFLTTCCDASMLHGLSTFHRDFLHPGSTFLTWSRERNFHHRNYMHLKRVNYFNHVTMSCERLGLFQINKSKPMCYLLFWKDYIV